MPLPELLHTALDCAEEDEERIAESVAVHHREVTDGRHCGRWVWWNSGGIVVE